MLRQCLGGELLCGAGLHEFAAVEDRGDGRLQVLRSLTKDLNISELPSAHFLKSEERLIVDEASHFIRGLTEEFLGKET